jgi:hypothetical protein
MQEIGITNDEYFSIMAKNFLEYYNDNTDNANKFAQYNNINFLKGASSRDIYPKQYANIGYLPI